MPITTEQLVKIFPATPRATLQQYVAPLNATMAKHSIGTKLREAMFLAQVGHESGGLKFVEENLNYGWQGLRRIFGKYFPTDILARRYERRKEAIANKVYANRMGNGDEASGDGWRFRGRGLIQITGKNNYLAIMKAYKFSTIEATIAWMETPEGETESAGWFWTANNLNQLSDASAIISVTKKINGGTNGIDDRKAIYARALATL